MQIAVLFFCVAFTTLYLLRVPFKGGNLVTPLVLYCMAITTLVFIIFIVNSLEQKKKQTYKFPFL